MDLFYTVLGLLAVAFEAADRVLKSVTKDVGGEGVLVALVFGVVAYAMITGVKKKIGELEERIKELEVLTGKVERLEEGLTERVEELEEKIERLEEGLTEKVEELEEKIEELEANEDSE